MTFTQTSVAVNGNNVTVTAAGATGRRLVLQNRGDVPVFIQLGPGANVTAANGELTLAGGYVPDDGTGGMLEIRDYTGVVTAASAAPAELSLLTASP